MSSDAPRLKYDFSASPGSTYVRAAGLLAEEPPGRVLDLGAGVGSLAQAVATHGHGYIGVDADGDNVATMLDRGIDAVQLDLMAVDVIDRVVELVAPSPASPIVGVAMLDVIEHLPDPRRSVSLVTQIIDRIAELQEGRHPLLVVSIPNVAHSDLSVKFVTGRWDITEVGLLDETHVTLFTEERVHAMLLPWYDEAGRDDVTSPITEQRFPRDHPGFGTGGIGAFLRHLRGRSDGLAETYQFVRAYRRSSRNVTAALADSGQDAGQEPPFCSVILRTMGARMSLVDALTALASQQDRDLEVLLMVHHHDEAVADRLRALTSTFEPGFAATVHVHHIVGGDRSAPLNAGLDLAVGRYVAVLDDDDIVTSDWISVYKSQAIQHPGSLLRSNCVVQWIERRSTPLIDFEPVSGFEQSYPTHYDLLDTIRSNRTPMCAFVAPMETIRTFGITFDDTLRVCEDWKFQLDVARYAGFSHDPAITSVYRRWRGIGGSEDAQDREVWITDHNRVVDDLDAVPTVFPPGTMRRVHDLYTRIEHLERELGRRGPDDPPLHIAP